MKHRVWSILLALLTALALLGTVGFAEDDLHSELAEPGVREASGESLQDPDTEISAPAEDDGAGELPEGKLWTDEMAAAAAQTPEDAEIAAPLDEAWDKATIESWYEAAKEKAKSADHLLGKDGDILNRYMTLVLPGETIAVVPDNFGISDSGMVKYGLLTFNCEIYQLSNPVVETEYNGKNLLPRTGAPSRTTLTEVETSTFHVPYKAREGIEQIDEGSIFSYTYVSLYRNDTGLPIVMSNFDKFAKRESIGAMNGRGGNRGGLSFQGTGDVNYGPTFYFVENYYDVSLDLDTFTKSFQKTGKNTGDLVCSDGKTSWLNTKSPFTFKLYIDGEDHTYEIPNPLMKGYAFYGWESDRGSDGFWRWGNYLPKRSSSLLENTEYKYRYEMTNEKTVLRLNTRDYILEEGKHNASFHLFRDLILFPSFSWPADSQDTKTLGFNPQGGKIYGQDYYLCNASAFTPYMRFGVDIGTFVPERAGTKFKGWCTDPNKPEATLIKDTSVEASGAWRKEGHVELYAVWDGGTQPSASSIAKAVVTVKDQTYSGKTLKPAVTIKLDGKKLKNGTDYTVTYSKNKNIGTATVTVKGRGKYTGTANGTFRINPKAVKLSSLTAGKKQLTVKWAKGAGGAGYQIQYSLTSDFKSSKTATITKEGTVSTVLKKLQSGKKYYVRIRTYKKVGGKVYTSAWSKAASKKVK